MRKPFDSVADKKLCFITKSVHSNGDIDLELPNQVALKFSVSSLNLNEKEEHKLKLLSAERCDGQYITITCDRFPFAEQNKKWLLETYDRLMNEVKHGNDYFEDVKNIWIKEKVP